MKVLITGASGFVGSHVVKELFDNGYDIIALSARKIPYINTIDSLNYEFDTSYLHNCCPDIECIIHMGAFTPKAGGEANDIFRTTSNIRNTEKLLAAASKLDGLKKIIFISTLDVYEEANGALTEITPTIPQTMYGWSKLYCEQMIRTWAEQYQIQYEILRLGHVYGEGEEKYRKVMPVMIKDALSGKNIIIYGDGEAVRTFIYVGDVAKAIRNAIRHSDSIIINIVGNESITINQLAAMIVSISGSQVDIKHIHSDTPNRDIRFDNSKLMSSLLENLTELEVGLKREITYMRERLS